MLITDDLLFHYQRCSRRAFLNVHGDQEQKQPEKDFRQKLKEESENHCQNILAKFYPIYHHLESPQDDLWKRSLETENLMKQGVDCIYQGTLHYSNYDNVTYFGSPTLLVKQNIPSSWGKWSYYPVSIQFGNHPKTEYKILSGFYGYLLNKVQGLTPSTSILILRDCSFRHLNLKIWIDRCLQEIKECLKMLRQKIEPEVFISRQRCSLCQWYNSCYQVAKSTQHLSLVPGITPKRYEYLQQSGITNLELLKDLNISEIVPFIESEIAINLQKQAKSLLENIPILKSNPITSLPSANIELYFDIEAEPSRSIHYLLGVLLVDHGNNDQKYYPFLAQTLNDEEKIWREFLHFVNQYPSAPIFHYSNFELETIRKLGKLYQTPTSEIETLLTRLIDLHQQVLNSVIFPTENYSLKTIANWLGFSWRNPLDGDQLLNGTILSGDQCVCWYDQWLKTSDDHWLNCILRYNEDDCLATYHLKTWICNYYATKVFSFT